MESFDTTALAATVQSPVGHLDPGLIPNTASIFPTEIYERIIDFLPLAYDGSSRRFSGPLNLASCCLTSRSWVPRCRFRLYFKVKLDSRERFEMFVHSLEINSSNSAYVRKLSIDSLGDETWVSAVSLALAPKLKNLRRLYFSPIDVASLHSSFPQHLATFSTVSELELRGENFRGLSLMRILFAFPYLQKFLVTTMNPLSSNDEAATLAMARRKGPTPLRHLSLYDHGIPVLLPALVASATPLVTLYLFLSPSTSAQDTERGLRSLGLFLSSCVTLRTLRLNFTSKRGRDVCPYLSLSSLPNLRHVLLTTVIEESEDIAAVAGLVSSISAHSLQFLQLILNARSSDVIPNTPAFWEVLNESFLLPTARSIREIAISIEVGYGAYISKDELFQLLPALKTSNIVDCWSYHRYQEFWKKL